MTGNIHVVSKGETLAHIAVKYDVSINWLKSKNNLFSDYVFLGQKLIVSDDSRGTDEQETTGIILDDNNNNKIIEQNLNPDDTHENEKEIELGSKVSADSRVLYDSCITLSKQDETIDSLDVVEKQGISQSYPILKSAKDYQKEVCEKGRKVDNTTRRRNIFPIKIIDQPMMVLPATAVDPIRRHFPGRYVNRNWKPLYRLSCNGCSYATFYELVSGQVPLILVFKNEFDEIFGAFISTCFKVDKYYYGNEDCFVFKVNESDVDVYHWTRSNTLFITSNMSDITIGGGDWPAIHVNQNFVSGLSGECATYGSPRLTKNSFFRVLDVEAISVV